MPDAAEPEGVAKRDYTPGAFDAARRALTTDFVLHDAGPASDWVDPVCSLGLGLFLAYAAAKLSTDALHLALAGVPPQCATSSAAFPPSRMSMTCTSGPSARPTWN